MSNWDYDAEYIYANDIAYPVHWDYVQNYIDEQGKRREINKFEIVIETDYTPENDIDAQSYLYLEILDNPDSQFHDFLECCDAATYDSDNVLTLIRYI